MEEWKEYRLGDVCNTISDTYKDSAENVVLINTSDVLEGKCLNHVKTLNKDLKGQFKKTFRKDDILYSEIRPANKRYAYIDFDATNYIASTKLMVIRHNERILPQYLFYILKSQAVLDELQMLAESRSGTFPQITFSEVANMEIKLPPIEQQRLILGVLKSLDDKIEVNRKINENLEQQAQALFKSWFVDFEPFKNGEFVESELGMIPKGWRVGTLDDLLEIKYGKDHKKLSDGKIPVYGSGGLMRRVDKSLYKGESVLIPRKGTLNNVMYVNEEFWTVDTMFYTIPKVEHIALFCYLFLLGKDLASMNAGSAVPSMTTEILNSMPVVIPQNSIVNEFDNVISSYFRKIENNDNEFRRLSELRDTLLPKLMSGELKVGDVLL